MVVEHCSQNTIAYLAEWRSRLTDSYCRCRLALSLQNEAGEQINLRGAVKDFWYNASLWFALPISIWVASGLPGLLLHWQTVNSSEEQHEGAPESLQASLFDNYSQSLAGEASCAAMQSEAP